MSVVRSGWVDRGMVNERTPESVVIKLCCRIVRYAGKNALEVRCIWRSLCYRFRFVVKEYFISIISALHVSYSG